MKSFIVSFVYDFVYRLCQLVSQSAFWKGIDKIYNGFKNAFSGSGVVRLVKSKGKTRLEETSFLCKALRIPTGVLSAICKIFSKLVRDFTDNSMVSKYAKGYLGGSLSLDVRFFALITLFSCAVGFVLNFFRGKIVWPLLILAVAGFMLSFVRARLADYIDDSVFVRLIKASLGFENISFNIYKKNPSLYVYMSAAIVGTVAGVCAVIHPFLVAVAPGAVFALIAMLASPLLGIFLAVFFAPILPTMAVVGICVLTAFSALAHKSNTGEYGIKMGRCGLCLMLFLIISAISTVFSHSITGSIGVLGMYIIFITFYYIIRDQVRRVETLEGIFKIFALSAAVVSIYGILQYVFGWNTQNAWIDETMFEEATMRAYSTLANPNVLGEYLILALPIVAVVFVNWTKTLWQKIVYGAFFCMTFLCLVLTQSRGCWIGFFVSAIIFVSYYRSSLWKIIPFVLLVLPFVLPDTIINRLLSVGDMSDSSTSYRVFIWLGTLNMLQHFWIGGIGLGEAAFRSVYPYYSYTGIVAPHSHNLYLQLIVESGVINLGVFVAAMFIFFKDMINVQASGRKLGIIATALMSGVIGFLVQSMFDYTFYNYRVMGIFFMVLAFGGAVCTISSKQLQTLDEERN